MEDPVTLLLRPRTASLRGGGADGVLSGAPAQGVVAGGEERSGHLQAEGRLSHGLVLGELYVAPRPRRVHFRL